MLLYPEDVRTLKRRYLFAGVNVIRDLDNSPDFNQNR
jgi:hypothetical protein